MTHIPTRDIPHLCQSFPPSLYLLIVMLECLFMFGKVFTVNSFLMSHLKRINIIENRQDTSSRNLTTLKKDVFQFSQAPCWGSIVFWEDHDENLRSFNCMKEFGCYEYTFLKFSVISECKILFLWRAAKKWSMKLKRVSSPLSLQTHHNDNSSSLVMSPELKKRGCCWLPSESAIDYELLNEFI